MDKFTATAKNEIADAGRLYCPVAHGQQGRMGDVEINDADFWRGKYDELLHHIKHQNQYLRFLEREVFGGSPF